MLDDELQKGSVGKLGAANNFSLHNYPITQYSKAINDTTYLYEFTLTFYRLRQIFCSDAGS